ncbi:palmitoyltransferase ZDHHC11-like isoform X2 [Hippopotamus amphibius kiboko]|uniref:palmitoyltransferase ZDHHC11-like isoform X2 n=1 Tax=Hippopotamus amphibius kiboko TaxID=575201 RepID=UPI002591ADC9|nr:palmitoyltransferase ZDHHC11-like isoform X2 [Hippopotamus amphibius kiboko]
MVWTLILTLTFSTFAIFIPFLPLELRFYTYSVTGGILVFHVFVHLSTISIDPAESNVRLRKIFSEPVSSFDRSKHGGVIQNQYCRLCEVAVSPKAKHCSVCNKCVSGFDHHCKWLNNCVGARNYWYFMASVTSALAGLVCMIAITLFTLVQYFLDPARLRSDPHYLSVPEKDVWLLFLPLFPVRTNTTVLLVLCVSVLLLELVSLMLLGHLFCFHLYLRIRKLTTFEYVMRSRRRLEEQRLAGRRDVALHMEGLSQQERYRRSPILGWERRREYIPPSRRLSVFPDSPVPPGIALLRKDPIISQNSSLRMKALDILPLPVDRRQDSAVVHGESSLLLLQGLDASLGLPVVGVKQEALPPLPSRNPSLCSLSSICPESSPKLQVKDQEEISQPVEGDVAENQGSASGAQGPAPAESPIQESLSIMIPPEETDLNTISLPSPLQAPNKVVCSQGHHDILTGHRKPCSVESTVINIPGMVDDELVTHEVPQAWAFVPSFHLPTTLSVIQEEESEIELTPVVSLEEGCNPKEDTEPTSCSEATVITMPEDPELSDGAPPQV